MKEYISNFKENGYVVIDLDFEIINKVRQDFISILKKHVGEDKKKDGIRFLEEFHNLNIKNLNDTRLSTISDFNLLTSIKERLYDSTQGVIDSIVGNDLAVQKNINLSFQLPGDDSSLLPLHSDVWSGNSPFEAVLWVPFVDVHKSKSMYILPRKYSLKYHRTEELKKVSLSELFENEKDNFVWPNVKFGQAIIFSHSLLHGNIVNTEKESRFSLNLRFKSITSPYGSKALGDYFVPFRITPMTELGWEIYGK